MIDLVSLGAAATARVRKPSSLCLKVLLHYQPRFRVDNKDASKWYPTMSTVLEVTVEMFL